jgi:hypothetical protein
MGSEIGWLMTRMNEKSIRLGRDKTRAHGQKMQRSSFGEISVAG